MMAAVFEALQKAEADDATKVAVLTGTGKYYCAGVDLGGTVGLAMPKVCSAIRLYGASTTRVHTPSSMAPTPNMNATHAGLGPKSRPLSEPTSLFNEQNGSPS